MCRGHPSYRGSSNRLEMQDPDHQQMQHQHGQERVAVLEHGADGAKQTGFSDGVGNVKMCSRWAEGWKEMVEGAMQGEEGDLLGEKERARGETGIPGKGKE